MDATKKKTNIKNMTFFTGFWSTDDQTYNFDSFKEAGIDKMIFERAVEFSSERVHTEDISDINKSKKKVCKISWVQ